MVADMLSEQMGPLPGLSPLLGGQGFSRDGEPSTRHPPGISQSTRVSTALPSDDWDIDPAIPDGRAFAGSSTRTELPPMPLSNEGRNYDTGDRASKGAWDPRPKTNGYHAFPSTRMSEAETLGALDSQDRLDGDIAGWDEYATVSSNPAIVPDEQLGLALQSRKIGEGLDLEEYIPRHTALLMNELYFDYVSGVGLKDPAKSVTDPRCIIQLWHLVPVLHIPSYRADFSAGRDKWDPEFLALVLCVQTTVILAVPKAWLPPGLPRSLRKMTVRCTRKAESLLQWSPDITLCASKSVALMSVPITQTSISVAHSPKLISVRDHGFWIMSKSYTDA